MKNSNKHNWQIKKLGELAEYINGYPFKPTDWVSSGLPIIRIQNLNNADKEYHYFSGDIGEKYRVGKGDILISWSASLGSYIWDKNDAWLNQHIFKVKVNENAVNKDFFYFISMTVLEEMKRKTHGGTMKHITKNLFENIQVQVPPLSIQYQIVEKLDAIRKLQELNNKEIEKTEGLFNSFLANSFKPQEKRQIEKLGKVADILMGQSPPSSTYNNVGEGLPFFQGKADFNDLYPTIVKYCFKPVRVAQKDDILLSVRAPVGPVNLAPSEVCIGRGLSAIRAKEKVLNQMYLFYFMKLNELALSKKGTGSTFYSVNRRDIEKIDLPLPSLSVQKQITRQLDSLRTYQASLKEQRVKLLEFFESTLNKIFKQELLS